jgi:hypothetical protein
MAPTSPIVVDFPAAVRSSQEYRTSRKNEFQKWTSMAAKQAEDALLSVNAKYRESGNAPDATTFCEDMAPIIRQFANETAKWMAMSYELAAIGCDALKVPNTVRMSTVSNIVRDEFQQCHLGLMEPIRRFGHDVGVDLREDSRWSELQRPLFDTAMQIHRRILQDLEKLIPISEKSESIRQYFEQEESADLRLDGINLRREDVITRFVSQFQADADLYFVTVQKQ